MVNGVNCVSPVDVLFAMSLDVELRSTLYLGIPIFIKLLFIDCI